MGNAGGVMLHIDTSQLTGLVSRMEATLTPYQFQKLMRRVLAPSRVGSHVRMTLKKELPNDYQATPAWIGQQVGSPRGAGAGGAFGCSIPVEGARGRIGKQFAARAGAGGHNITKGFAGRKGSRTRRAYEISASIVTSGNSILPSKGDAIHFAVFGGPKKGFYARLPGEGNKIRPAVGIGVPQMPTNRSEDNVQEEILYYLKQRIEHEYNYLISRCR
ncbi:MAG: hypothetical protein LLF96_07095 [Eubacteriales bacterium]|nr:hypothetical protein [Eubacteriales bacterium]